MLRKKLERGTWHGMVRNSRWFHAARLQIIPKTYFLRPKTVTSSSKAHNMQPLVHARVTEIYPFSSKENYNRKHIRRGRTCTRKTSSLTRLNDFLGKTLLQEAKRNGRSNEFVLSSERAEFAIVVRFKDIWERMGLTVSYTGTGEGEKGESGGGGEERKKFCFTNVF